MAGSADHPSPRTTMIPLVSESSPHATLYWAWACVCVYYHPGMIVIDAEGNIGCGTSTNGATHKIAGWGRPKGKETNRITRVLFPLLNIVVWGIHPSLGLVAMWKPQWEELQPLEMVMSWWDLCQRKWPSLVLFTLYPKWLLACVCVYPLPKHAGMKWW